MFWPQLLTYAGLGTHVVLGVGGWFVQLVVSTSYYLLPRFAGVRHFGTGWLGTILVLLNAGFLVVIAATLVGSELLVRIGVALLALAGVLYAWDLERVLRRRQRTKPDLTILHWWAMLGQTVTLSVLAGAWSVGALTVEGARLAAAATVLVLVGWVTLAIMGQLYKVTPFLMWYYRYARGIPAIDVPRLSAPYYPTAGVVSFHLTWSGSTLLAGAVLIQLPAIGMAASLLAGGGAFVFCYILVLSWIRAIATSPKQPT